MSYSPVGSFNQSLSSHYNYTFFPGNGTISNQSSCYLYFQKYAPILLGNGTVLNGTACDSPLRPVYGRGGLGIAFAIVFVLTIPGILYVLFKHGRRHLREEKNFKVIGRQWPWYWLLLCALLTMLTGFFSIDIDRSWVLGDALALFGALYCCTLPTCLGAVWEMTRHWGSFQHRKMMDADAWALPHNSQREQFELVFPLVFYAFAFLNFFLATFHSWSSVERLNIAAATDGRFKGAGFCGIIAWICVVVFFVFSLRTYEPDAFPWKVPLCLIAILIRICYQTAGAYDYSISPFNPHAADAYIYTLGFAPLLAVFVTMIASGLREPNEDQELIRRRKERRAIDMMKVRQASNLHHPETPLMESSTDRKSTGAKSNGELELFWPS